MQMRYSGRVAGIGHIGVRVFLQFHCKQKALRSGQLEGWAFLMAGEWSTVCCVVLRISAATKGLEQGDAEVQRGGRCAYATVQFVTIFLTWFIGKLYWCKQ